MAKLKPNDLTSSKSHGRRLLHDRRVQAPLRDLAAARRNLENSRDRRKDLVDREPRNVVFGRDLGLVLYRLGKSSPTWRKTPTWRKRQYAESLKIREDLARISEAHDRRQTELMLALAHAGQTVKALELADRFSVGPNVDREQRIFLAACYAQVARATPPDKAEQIQTALVKAATVRVVLSPPLAMASAIAFTSKLSLDPRI